MKISSELSSLFSGQQWFLWGKLYLLIWTCDSEFYTFSHELVFLRKPLA